jgi:nucleoside-diphosphate-sugar epimerase
VSEQGPTPADLGPYAEAQLEAEKLAASYPESIRLRPGCEYGPDCVQWTALIARRLMQHRLGDLGAGGDGYCNLLFIDDLVAAILKALQMPEARGRVFNLAMPSPPTWNDYFRIFAKALGAVPLRRITRRRLAIETKLLAPPLKIGEIVASRAGLGWLRLPPPIPPSLLRLCRQEIRMDVRSAQEQLGIRWTDLDSGLRSAAQWYLSTGRKSS